MPNVIETTDAAASAATAYTLGIGQTARGAVSSGGDRDWYAVELAAGQTYTFALTGTGANDVTDTLLSLFAADGVTALASDDDGFTGLSSIITFTATATGTHYLEAGAFDGTLTGQYGLAASLGAKASFDVDMGAGSIDGDLTWAAGPGAPATVSYGFRQSAASYTVDGSDISTFTQLTAAQIAAVEACLGLISEVAGVAFNRVNAAGYTNNATILFANYFDATDGAGAFAFGPGSTAAAGRDGDVWLNTDSVSTTDLPAGSFSFATILHETMHAIGFSHPGQYNADPDIDITYAAFAQFVQDSEQYSVMSYFDAAETGAVVGGSPQTLMLFDMLALQNQHGANTATRSGATTYGFGGNAGATYDFAVNADPAFTIWDGGGVDRLNASGFAMNQVIDLREGGFSNIGGFVKNFAIAAGAVIENATGGGGADKLVGNGAANILSGGNGDDTLIGGAGSDTASYAGASARVKVALDGSIAFEGDALGDTFSSIARLAGTRSSDILIGDANANVISGGSGNDTIRGKDGNDLLKGERGGDSLGGGLGDDRFSYSALDQGGDTIIDFHNAVGDNDSFNFSGAAFGGLAVGALAANRFASNATGLATTAYHRFIYETDTGILRYDANGSAAGGVTVIATLTGAPALTVADFAII